MVEEDTGSQRLLQEDNAIKEVSLLSQRIKTLSLLLMSKFHLLSLRLKMPFSQHKSARAPKRQQLPNRQEAHCPHLTRMSSLTRTTFSSLLIRGVVIRRQLISWTSSATYSASSKSSICERMDTSSTSLRKMIANEATKWSRRQCRATTGNHR